MWAEKSCLVWLLFFLSSFSRSTDGKIGWSKTKLLQRADFMSPVPENSPYKATTKCEIVVNSSLQKETLNMVIRTQFISAGSWMKPEASEMVLSHERQHFNIYEICARNIRKELAATDTLTTENYEEVIKKVYRKNFSLCNKMNAKYDEETQHSVDDKSQFEWEKKIGFMLQNLSKHQSEAFSVRVMKRKI